MIVKIVKPLWYFFTSVKLTIMLLILLAATSIFGTVIPQQEGAIEFIRGLNPAFVKLMNSFQLFDMYHSVWFRLIICCLALNLVICSINRFPATLKLFRHKPKPDRLKPFEKLPPYRALSVKGDMKEISGIVTESIRVHYKNIAMKDHDRANFIYGERGHYTLFSVYLVHFSVLIILIGAIIGSMFGFRAYVNIVEGESTDTVILRSRVGQNNKKLGFSIYCKKFTVDFYDNGVPKEYRSDLDFIIDGRTVKKGTLLVNHPITFEGITFYQASYGSLPGNKATLKITKGDSDSKVSTLEVTLGRSVILPDGGGQIYLSDIRDDFMRMGPAALITIKTAKGDVTEFWLFKDQDLIKKRFPGIFKNFPKLNPSAYNPYTFHLDAIESKYYTGLEVNRDPGVFLVYAGFLIIMVGLFFTFFTSHRRIWIRIKEKDGLINVSVTGRANKNPVGMERELDQLAQKFNEILTSEGES